MTNAITTFNTCISDIRNMRSFYEYLRDHCNIPEDNLSDLLRSELVNLVSAMDRFLHEIVRVGIINSYLGHSTQTLKCQAIPLKFSTLMKVIECGLITSPTSNEEIAEYWINKEVVEVLKKMSFQQVSKIKDALSYIWDVEHKMPLIIQKMIYSFSQSTDNEKQRFMQEKIDLIVARRNQIVHEADFDLATNSKQSINTIWLDDTINFIKDFVYSIYENITNNNSFNRL